MSTTVTESSIIESSSTDDAETPVECTQGVTVPAPTPAASESVTVPATTPATSESKSQEKKRGSLSYTSRVVNKITTLLLSLALQKTIIPVKCQDVVL